MTCRSDDDSIIRLFVCLFVIAGRRERRTTDRTRNVLRACDLRCDVRGDVGDDVGLGDAKRDAGDGL